MKRGGARSRRFKDLGWKNPYDGYIFYSGTFMPFEAKFLDESRKSYNVLTWIKNQPHQFEELAKDNAIEAKPFMVLFSKRGRIRWKVANWQVVLNAKRNGGKIVLDNLPEARTIDDLMVQVL